MISVRKNRVARETREGRWNRPSGELDHVLGYYLAAVRWMAGHPSVHFDHKALSAIERRIPSLIILLKINRNERRTTRLLGYGNV